MKVYMRMIAKSEIAERKPEGLSGRKDVESRCLRQLRGRVGPRGWFGNHFLRPKLVFGQRSVKISVCDGCLHEWCGGWGKETEKGGGRTGV